MRLCAVETGVLISAFRYSLGRKTYVSEETSKAIGMNLANLCSDEKDLIVREIEEAIEKNQAGMDCDVEHWKELRDKILKDDRPRHSYKKSRRTA